MLNNQNSFISKISEQSENVELPIPIGLDENGKLHLVSLNQTGNIIIGGSTGSGKSIFNHNLICSLILKYDSSKLKLFLADPKRVELSSYNGIPHLIEKVYFDSEEIINRLTSLKKELLNKKYPYLVIVIDTFSDLMMYDSDRFEAVISDLSQLNKKGVFIIICDSRPSIGVFTDKLIEFFPTRIAFNLSSEADSKRVIGKVGAENLLGKGDMLFLQKGEKNTIRLQGLNISDEDCDYCIKSIGGSSNNNTICDPYLGYANTEKDEKYDESIKVIKNYKKISIPIIQKSLHIGYARAARIIQHLEEDGLTKTKNENYLKPRKLTDPENEREQKEGFVIEQTLEAFGIRTKIAEINKKKGGVEYCLDIRVGTPVEEILKHKRDIALAVASPTGKVTIQAPIPGRPLVGIFVPIMKN